MKKLFCVNLILVILLVLTSCTTLKTNDETLVNTALNLANKYCQLNEYQDALDVYNKALSSGYDYRLLYNKSIVLAKMGRFNDAVDTAELGYELFENIDFQILKAELYFNNNSLDEAYNLALNLWDNGVDNKRIVNILYAINPDEWAMINKVIY